MTENLGENQPAVAFESLSKGFGSQKVLDDISFALPTGEALCILGRSGTGKSVTLRLMIGLLKPDSGRVRKKMATRCRPHCRVACKSEPGWRAPWC